MVLREQDKVYKPKDDGSFFTQCTMLSIVLVASMITCILSFYIFYYHLDDTHQDTNHWIFETKRYVNYHLRIFLIMIHPYLDWSYLHESDCLISANYLSARSAKIKAGQQSDDLKCITCQENKHILKIFHELPQDNNNKIDYEYTRGLIYDLIKSDRPFVMDAQLNNLILNEWYIKKNIRSMMDILDYYARYEMIEEVCHIKTNFSPKSLQGLYVNLFTERKRHLHERWFASWQNCKRWSKKMFRSMYNLTALQWLPTMIEFSGGQSIVASSANSQTLADLSSVPWQPSEQYYQLVPIHEDNNLAFMFQIEGYTRIELFTKCSFKKQVECSSVDRKLEIDLSPNQFLFYNSEIWRMSYARSWPNQASVYKPRRPNASVWGEESYNLAIILTGKSI